MEMKFIINKEQYLAIKKIWANMKEHTASELIIYNLLRGFPADRGFTPVTNKNKLSNGHAPWLNFTRERRSLMLTYTRPVENKWSHDHKASIERFESRLEWIGLPKAGELLDKMHVILGEYKK